MKGKFLEPIADFVRQIEESISETRVAICKQDARLKELEEFEKHNIEEWKRNTQSSISRLNNRVQSLESRLSAIECAIGFDGRPLPEAIWKRLETLEEWRDRGEK